MFKKILVANRGEIAVRIIRACKELNIPTVAIHSDVDKDAMHVRLAEESICIGSHKPQNSYLNAAAIMTAVDVTGSDAIHPGYGFLSENYHFAEIAKKNNIRFIGPSAEIIKKMGNKIEAKKIVKKLGLPIIEGSDENINSLDEAKKICTSICLGFSKNFSTYTSSLPKYFFASSLADGRETFNSFSFLTSFIPFPPPPADALIKIGYPILKQIFFASSKELIFPSDPSMMGRPSFFAIFFASILFPIFFIISALGPINFMLFFLAISAK